MNFFPFQKIFLGFIVCFMLVANSCLPPKTKADQKASVTDILAEIPAQLNAANIPFSRGRGVLCDIHLESLEKVMAQDSQDQELALAYADMLLNVGKTEASIERLTKILNEEGIEDPKKREHFKLLLAIAHLRLGEQTNCIHHHTSESCLFPIKGKGIYMFKQGPEKSIELLEELLEKKPHDPTTTWFLNLAYMTMGGYPVEVPPPYLIPPVQFKSDTSMNTFVDIAGKLGIDELSLSGTPIMDDFDRDGFLDIVVSNWDLDGQLKYFHNNGDGSFSDKTSEAGLIGQVGGLNINQTDYNNDGYLDILVLRGAWMGSYGQHPNSLLRNNKDGTFTDVTIEAGLFSRFPTQTAAWADFDKDGWLDVFIGNESDRRFQCESELYRNNGDGTFTNVAAETGILINGFVKGASWGDVNGDHLPDLYVSIMRGENLLFLNQGKKTNGQFAFEEVAEQMNVQRPNFSFPCWFWDYDNDGNEDIFVAPYLNDQTPMIEQLMGWNSPLKAIPGAYHNNGNGTFSNRIKKLNLRQSIYTMGANYGDFNGDGFLDFYLGTGAPTWASLVPNRMFLNQQGKAFEDVTYAANVGHLQKGHGIAVGDIDNDGDQDIYAEMGGAYTGDVFQNAMFINTGEIQNWIVMDFEGIQSNKIGLGNKIELTIIENDTKRRIYRRVSSGGSFGANSIRQEIGIGKAERIEQIKIWWTVSDKPQIFNEVEINQTYLIREGSKSLKPISFNKIIF